MTTIVFPPGKFVCYLRQPKSASLSMTKWMVEFAQINQRAYLTSLNYQQQNYNLDVEPDTVFTHHMTAQRIKDTVPQWWSKMEKIVTVRNPWDILASKFYHMRKLGVTQVPTDNFTDFCLALRSLRGTLNPGKDYYCIDNKIIADYIIPVEDLEVNLKEIFKGYKLPNMPHVNKGTVDNSMYRKLYTKEINKLVEKDFDFEITKFNYKF